MTSESGAIVSGADFDAQATRRRNVPSTSPNGGLVNRVEIDEKKTQAKQVGIPLCSLRTNVSGGYCG
jgi:dolichyl-phosphate-mannose-protein mannosyltransferase